MAANRGRTTARRLLNSILSSPWLIREPWLREFATLAEEARARGDDLTADEFRSRLRQALATLGDGEKPEALTVEFGEPLDGGYAATVRNGVAIIPVMGPLYHYANICTEVCGATAYATLARDLTAALASPSVSAILLEVDSPGGEVAGCAELAQMIYDARQDKRVVAYVSDLGCSGAYWLASAAHEIVAAPTAILGSIGVVMSYFDTRERDAKSGVRKVEVVSSQSPKKRMDPESDEGRGAIQQMLDDLAAVFVEAVARNRGVDAETVLSDFGQGGVMVGARAVEAGLCDRLGSFEGVLAELGEHPRGTPATGGTLHLNTEDSMNVETNAPPAADNQPAAVTADSIAADHPEAAEQLRAEGATRERERILGIQEIAVKGQEALAAVAINDGSTVEAFALRQAKEQKKVGAQQAAAGKKYLNAVQSDEDELDAPGPNAEEEPDNDAAVAARILNAGKRTPATPNR